MNLSRCSTALALTVALAACASVKPAVPSAPPAEDPAPVPASTPAEAATSAPPRPAPATAEGAPAPATAAGDAPASPPAGTEADYAAIYGQSGYDPVADPTLPAPVESPASYDPWEPFNRKVHRFNNAVDRTIARPLAQTYVRVVPRPVRLGVGNFFSNLGQPLTAVNSLLQGEPRKSVEALGRFLLNSTVGVFGIFDPASAAKMANRREDFGQTLGTWGWRRSRYVELPLFGPRTVRDVFGLVGDAPLSPLQQVEEDKVRIPLQGLQLVDVRAQLLSVDSMRDGAVDEYALFRDSWLQRRAYQIGDDGGRGDSPDSGAAPLPDYLLEEEANPTVPVDAMPGVIPQGG